MKKPKATQRPHAYLPRITVGGIAKEIPTGRECLPERWNSRAGRVMGTKEDVRQLNSYLDTLQTKVYEVRRQLLEKNSIVNADHLRQHSRARQQAQNAYINFPRAQMSKCKAW